MSYLVRAPLGGGCRTGAPLPVRELLRPPSFWTERRRRCTLRCCSSPERDLHSAGVLALGLRSLRRSTCNRSSSGVDLAAVVATRALTLVAKLARLNSQVGGAAHVLPCPATGPWRPLESARRTCWHWTAGVTVLEARCAPVRSSCDRSPLDSACHFRLHCLALDETAGHVFSPVRPRLD